MNNILFQINEHITVIDILVKAIGFIITAFGVFLVWVQIKKTGRRDYIQKSYSTLSMETIIQPYQETIKKCRDCGFQIENGIPIEKDIVEKIYSNSELRKTVYNVLNELDKIAIGVLCGVIDHDIAYEMHSNTIMRGYRTFAIFIEYVREKNNRGIPWSQLQYLEEKWSELENERELLKQKATFNKFLQTDMVHVSPQFNKSFSKAIKRSKE